MYNNHSISDLNCQANKFLFDLECAGKQAFAEIYSIRVAVYNMTTETIYWFVDMLTDEEFVTSNLNDAIAALVYAVS